MLPQPFVNLVRKSYHGHHNFSVGMGLPRKILASCPAGVYNEAKIRKRSGSMGLEFELKYAADDDLRQRMVRELGGDWVRTEMETIYYDTPAGDLARLRFTLRRRLENGRAVCTVKTPAGSRGRGEWECPCGRIEDAVPVLCGLGAPEELAALTRGGLVPICSAKFTRLSRLESIPGGQVEIALDGGLLLGGGRTAPLGEAEVELKSGTPEDAEAWAGALAARFGLKPEKKSKFRRALALAKGEQP